MPNTKRKKSEVIRPRIPPPSSKNEVRVRRRRVKQRIDSAPDCSFNNPSQPAVYYYSGPDCFNKLSDDIIIRLILPLLLDLKERIRSSLLSRRWRHLWRHTHHIGANLVFPHALKAACFVSVGCRFKCRHVQKNLIPYINWVDSTLTYFPGTELDCFSVCHELDSRFSPVLHRWLLHALRLGAKKLRLHLGPFPGRTPVSNYEFPSVDILSRLFHVDLNAYPACTLGISYLKELSLGFVDIAGQTVEYLLSSCPLLEFISLNKSAACQYLRIAGPSLRLKYLQVLGCLPLEKLDISAPNLITLKYDGSKEALFFTSIPRLEQLGMSGKYFGQFCDNLWQRPWPHFGDYFFQLKSLEFEMPEWQLKNSTYFPLELPVLFKLEEVKVKMDSGHNLVCLWPCCLLKSAPRLKRFVVEVGYAHDDSTMKVDEVRYWSVTETMKEATKCKHPCLKVVELVRYGGTRSEFQLSRHLVSCAESLEKLVIDTGGKLDEIGGWICYLRKLPPCVELVLL